MGWFRSSRIAVRPPEVKHQAVEQSIPRLLLTLIMTGLIAGWLLSALVRDPASQNLELLEERALERGDVETLEELRQYREHVIEDEAAIER